MINRPRTVNNPATSVSHPVDTSFAKRGLEGFEHARRIQAANAQKMQTGYMPSRFWLRDGEETNIVILERSTNNLFFTYEHNFADPSDGYKFSGHELCCSSYEPCPICSGAMGEKGSRPYYAVFLSILDLRPYTYTDKNNQQIEVPFTRKLLVIKSSQMSMFSDILINAEQQYGSLYGVVLKLRRDSSDDARHGIPKIVTKGSLFARFSQDTMLNKFSHPAKLNKDGKVIVEANGYLEPFDLSNYFKKPTAAGIAARWGISGYGKNNTDTSDFDNDFEDYGEFNDTDNVNTNVAQNGYNKSSAVMPTGNTLTNDNKALENEMYDDDIPF